VSCVRIDCRRHKVSVRGYVGQVCEVENGAGSIIILKMFYMKGR
jgi:hypothetical protein